MATAKKPEYSDAFRLIKAELKNIEDQQEVLARKKAGFETALKAVEAHIDAAFKAAELASRGPDEGLSMTEIVTTVLSRGGHWDFERIKNAVADEMGILVEFVDGRSVNMALQNLLKADIIRLRDGMWFRKPTRIEEDKTTK